MSNPNFTLIERMSITEFRKRFSELMKDPEAEVIITKNGKDVCAFLGINAYNKYRILVNNFNPSAAGNAVKEES